MINISDRKSTRLNSSHTVIYTLSLHDALPILKNSPGFYETVQQSHNQVIISFLGKLDNLQNYDKYIRSEEHTSELQSHSDLHSFPTRRSSDLEEQSRILRNCSAISQSSNH